MVRKTTSEQEHAILTTLYLAGAKKTLTVMIFMSSKYCYLLCACGVSYYVLIMWSCDVLSLSSHIFALDHNTF
jgi:hypothetical protein